MIYEVNQLKAEVGKLKGKDHHLTENNNTEADPQETPPVHRGQPPIHSTHQETKERQTKTSVRLRLRESQEDLNAGTKPSLWNA